MKLLNACCVLLAATLLSSIAFVSQASSLATEHVEICSVQVGNSLNECPENFEVRALSLSQIHSEFTSCDGFSAMCIGGDFSLQSRKSYVTFFDIDNVQTVKYEVSITPHVYDPQGNLVLSGSKFAREIDPSAEEIELTETFAAALYLKKQLQDMYTLTINQSGGVSDASGQASSVLPRSAESCLTALDFIANERKCGGDLVRDIRDGARDNATFNATIDALNKLDSVISAVSLGRIDLNDIEELSEFKIILRMDDKSELVLNVKVDQGAVEIVLNEDASITSSGRTFRQALQRGVVGHGGLTEARLVAGEALIPMRCKPVTAPGGSQYVFVEAVEVRQPDGSMRVINIYREQEMFVTFLACNP